MQTTKCPARSQAWPGFLHARAAHSLLAGRRFQKFDALEIALQREIAVVELERAADAVLVKLKGERIGGCALAGPLARIEKAHRHRIALDRSERRRAHRLLEIVGLARDRAADHR